MLNTQSWMTKKQNKLNPDSNNAKYTTLNDPPKNKNKLNPDSNNAKYTILNDPPPPQKKTKPWQQQC